MIIRDFSCVRDGLFISGKAYLPGEAAVKYPVVILSHGFNGSSEHSVPYVERFCEAGIACVSFDFCGGAMESPSGGKMSEMTVFTELQDLLTVLVKTEKAEFADPERIFLMGRSQGGLVSAMAAAGCPEKIRGLVLLYPAFNLPDAARKMYPDPADVPETLNFLEAEIGRCYYRDVVKVQSEELQKAYRGKVLILQGQKDETVPPEYAEKAAGTYAHARLIRLGKAGHGFEGADFTLASGLAVQFVKELC